MNEYDILNKEIINYNKDKFEVIENPTEEVKLFYKILIDKNIVKVNKHGKMKKNVQQKVLVGSLRVRQMFGFVTSSEDIYIHNPQGFFDDDIVVVLVDESSKGKTKEGTIIGLISPGKKSLLVEVKKDKNMITVEPNYKSYNISLSNKEELDLFNERQIIAVEVVRVKKRNLVVKFKQVISDSNDPDIQMKLVLYSKGIETEFSQKTLDQIQDINEIQSIDLINRTDLRNKMTMTIDGKDAKDLDDAVSLIKEGENYRLTVSIADVSNYVVENTPLDVDAYSRSTSVYFVDRVVPMLPKKLSNGICSLHPNIDRLTLSCEMLIDKSGNILDKKIYPSVINSNYRLTYDQVNDVVKGENITEINEIKGILFEMNKLAKILNKKRIKRGSFNLEDKDAKFVISDEGRILDILPFKRHDAEKMIEEFMILANECVAQTIYFMELPFIYRIHDKPNPKKLMEVLSLLSLMKINIKGDVHEFKPTMFKQALDQLEDETSKRIVSDLIVRSLSKARYQQKNTGHFGLASECYTHFTSPIRRYPDLIVHRKLRKYLFLSDTNYSNKDMEKLDEIGAYTSEKEVNAIKAEQLIEDMKKAEYMEQFISQQYEAILASITDYGFFVELENTVRGLIKFSNIKEFVKSINHKVYFSDKSILTIGSKIKVTLKSVDVTRGTIEFELDDYTMDYRTFNDKKSKPQKSTSKDKKVKFYNHGKKKTQLKVQKGKSRRK